MPRLPRDLGLPGFDPGSDPYVSPARTEMGAAAQGIEDATEFLQGIRNQADHHSYTEGMASLERDVSTFLLEAETNQSARNTAEAFAEQFKDRAAGIANEVRFSNQARNEAQRRAAATLHLASMKLKELDAKRRRQDSLASIGRRMETLGTMDEAAGVSRTEAHAHAMSELGSIVDLRDVTLEEANLFGRATMASFEHLRLSRLASEGKHGEMEAFLSGEGQDRVQSLTTEQIAGWRAKVYELRREESLAYQEAELTMSAERGEAALGATRPYIRLSDFYKGWTAIEMKRVEEMFAEVRRAYLDRPQDEMHSKVDIEAVLEKYSDVPEIAKIQIRNANSQLSGEQRLRRLQAWEDSRKWIDKDNEEWSEQTATRFEEAALEYVATGNPELLEFVNARTIENTYRHGFGGLRAKDRNRMWRALLRTQNVQKMSEAEIAYNLRLSQINSGQRITNTNLDRKILRAEELRRYAMENDPKGLKPETKWKVGLEMARDYQGFVTQGLAEQLVSGIRANEPEAQWEAANNFTLLWAGPRGHQVDFWLRNQGVGTEEIDLLKAAAVEVQAGAPDIVQAMLRARRRADDIKIAPEERTKIAVKTFELGLTAPVIEGDQSYIPGGDQLIPVDRANRDPQGYLKLFHKVLSDSAYDNEDPVFQRNREWVLDHIITEGDFDELRAYMPDGGIGSFRIRVREVMRLAIQTGRDPITAAVDAVNDTLTSGNFGIEDLFTGGSERFVFGPFSRSATDIDTPVGSLTAKEWGEDALRQTIFPFLRKAVVGPGPDAPPSAVQKLHEQALRGGIRWENLEPTQKEQVRDFLFQHGDSLMGQLYARVYANLDLGDPDTVESIAYLATFGIEKMDYLVNESGVDFVRFVAQVAANRMPDLVDPQLQSWLDSESQEKDEGYNAAIAFIQRWKDQIRATQQPPIRFIPQSIGQVGEPTVYNVYFQPQTVPGQGWVVPLNRVDWNEPQQRFVVTEDRLQITIQPEDSPKAQRLLAKDARREQLDAFAHEGMFERSDAPIEDRLAKSPGAALMLQRDPLLRREWARRAASATIGRIARPGDRSLQQWWLDQLDMHLGTNTEPLGPQEPTLKETIRGGVEGFVTGPQREYEQLFPPAPIEDLSHKPPLPPDLR